MSCFCKTLQKNSLQICKSCKSTASSAMHLPIILMIRTVSIIYVLRAHKRPFGPLCFTTFASLGERARCRLENFDILGPQKMILQGEITRRRHTFSFHRRLTVQPSIRPSIRRSILLIDGSTIDRRSIDGETFNQGSKFINFLFFYTRMLTMIVL